MERKWTPAQQAAMSTWGQTLLVSAAAGSGKTATLTERIIRRLTHPEHPADLSRMLIVTFTRAAAAELKERISSALAEAIAKDPSNRHLQKQYMGLGGAHISTIDSFCREPVKAHFAELGLPASTRIADEAELAPLRERIMGEIIDEFYLAYATERNSGSTYSLLRNNPFADLCDSLTPFKNDQSLIPTLLSLYDRLLSFPEELERLRIQADKLSLCADGDFFALDHGAVLKEWLRLFCRSAAKTLEDALELMANDPPAAKAYEAAFSHDLTTCRALLAAETYGEVYALMAGYENLKLGSLRGATPELSAAKDARTDIYKTIKKLREDYFSDTPEALCRQMKETAAMCRVLFRLLTAYDERIMAEKKNRGICDFTDNRRYLLSLLRTSDGAATPLAAEFAARYDEVYIDEYQDVDEMQDEIFRLVGGDHRFMVGDIKQSIYVFRGADPSVFARYRRELPPLDLCDPHSSSAPHGNSIFMSDNFRCNESVIRVTNAVCGHVLRACPETVGYRDEDDLGFSKPATAPATPVRVAVITKADADGEDNAPRESDGELGGVEAEAAYVAAEIASLLRSGRLDNGNPIRPKDIVILMRSRRALSAYRSALNALRIPTEAAELESLEAGRDLLRGDDMYYLVNLLRVMDNPDNDIPLSEILRAPFPGLTLEEMTVLRGEGDPLAESHSLYAGCESYLSREDGDPVLRSKLSAFILWLEEYRRLTATQPADALLRILRRDPKCASRQAPAFLYLYDCARSYRTSSFLSLCVFLRYFESKLRTEKKAPVPADSSEDGHVSMMTIHNSKGLEFPVCFVVRCGQYFRHKTQSADLLFDKRVGVALKLYRRDGGEDRDDTGKTDTTLRRAAALSVRVTEREEEMRLLYVAMTRARERLYLVGTGNDKPHSFRAGDRYATLESNTYLKWVLAGLNAHPEVQSHAELIHIPADALPQATPLTFRHGQGTEDSQAEQAAYYERILRDRPVTTPAEELLGRIPATLPASKMRDHLLDTCVFYETDIPEDDGKLPEGGSDGFRCDVDSEASVRAALTLMRNAQDNEFELLLSAGRRPTAAERGTATHLFLQYCDYGRVTDTGLDTEIARLTDMGFLSKRASDILDRSMLEGFFRSEFFKRLRTAVRVERELKFNRLVPLSSLTESQILAGIVGDRTLMVRGSVDLLCEYPDGHLELCDYKTDHVTSAERRDPSLLKTRLIETHRDQIRQYAAAMAELYGKAPTHAYIFSLPMGEAYEIPL